MGDLKELFRLLRDGDKVERALAARELGKFEPSQEIIEVLIEALGDPYEWVRIRALESLRHHMPAKKEYAILLGKFYQLEDDPKVRATLVKTLAVCGEYGVSYILEALDDEDMRVKANAVEALEEIGYLPKLEKLLPLVSSGHRVRASVVKLLKKGKKDDIASKILEEMMKSGNVMDRIAAVYVIGEIKDNDKLDFVFEMAAVPEAHSCVIGALLKFENIEDEILKRIDSMSEEQLIAVFKVLSRVGTTKSVDKLKKISLTHESGYVRNEALETLEDITYRT